MLEPYGPRWLNLNFGRLASMLANIHRDSKKRPTPYEDEDFAFGWFGDKEEQLALPTPTNPVQQLASSIGAIRVKRKDAAELRRQRLKESRTLKRQGKLKVTGRL